ncbi:MAG: hypothetical protein J1E28_02300 [Helicobacter sp.]|uniref:hypothetical protein n=1 Tax=Helicobacter sp. TaxID=218 RepID=UPI0025C21157|nr:hypothetical protein [Helicobacter sp.]MCH5313218.1 hypothetical protein [Helicobacter sp.]
MMKQWFRILGIVALSGVIFAGCGTISNRPSQKVAITTSNGKPVIATIQGKFIDSKVELPAQVKISRAKGATISVRSEDNPCYEDTKLVIAGKEKVSGWFWGNIIWGGFTGSTTDAVTGGMWRYANPNFTVPVEQKANCKK